MYNAYINQPTLIYVLLFIHVASFDDPVGCTTVLNQSQCENKQHATLKQNAKADGSQLSRNEEGANMETLLKTF